LEERKLLRIFHQNLRYKFGSGFSYIATPEFGTKSTRRLHYHVLYFNLPSEINKERSTRILAKIWGNGFVDLIQTDGNAKLSGYLSKYMGKTFLDSRLSKKKPI